MSATPKFRSYSFKTPNTETVEAIIDAPHGALVVKRVFFPKSKKEKLYVELWTKGFASAMLRLDRTAKANPDGVPLVAMDLGSEASTSDALGLTQLFNAFPDEREVWTKAWVGEGESPPTIEGTPAAVGVDGFDGEGVDLPDPLSAAASTPDDALEAALKSIAAPTTPTASGSISTIDDDLFEEALCQMEPLEQVTLDPEDYGKL